MGVRVEGREQPAFAVAVVLLALAVVATMTAAAFLVRHKKRIESLHRQPSYIYGYNVDVYQPELDHAPSARIGCREYLAGHPARFRGFKIDEAITGCIDKWNAVNSEDNPDGAATKPDIGWARAQ